MISWNQKKIINELQQYSRWKKIEVLGTTEITEIITEMCNDDGPLIENRDIDASHRLFKKSKYTDNPVPEWTIVNLVNRQFAKDLL